MLTPATPLERQAGEQSGSVLTCSVSDWSEKELERCVRGAFRVVGLICMHLIDFIHITSISREYSCEVTDLYVCFYIYIRFGSLCCSLFYRGGSVGDDIFQDAFKHK